MQARGPCRVEDLSRSERFDVVGASHLDITDDIDEHADAKGFESAKYVGYFGHWGFDDGCTASDWRRQLCEKAYH